MAKQVRSQKPKHVPQRTCVACREVAGKRGLIRLVRTEAGVEIDPTGKRSGRGASLHAIRTCWHPGLKGNRIEQALRLKLSPENRRSLLEYAQSLPETDEAERTMDDKRP
ncbi:MAG: YlxR family protein [Anaerolineales bacterium]|nr:YlxR family protein [Anaerolineales bacterium]